MTDEDLGALCARATRRLVEAERPLLDALGLTMWEYIVLSRLERAPVDSQLELARAIGYDKTRLIALLDTLDGDGLIRRAPAPHDRRQRTVRLTAKGRRRHDAARTAIRAMEKDLLAGVAPARTRQLRSVLAVLAGARPDGS